MGSKPCKLIPPPPLPLNPTFIIFIILHYPLSLGVDVANLATSKENEGFRSSVATDLDKVWNKHKSHSK